MQLQHLPRANDTSAIAKPEAFQLLEGENQLGSYAWARQAATRSFCKRCRIHVFGRGHLHELGGDAVAIDVNALDDVDPNTLSVVRWDGRHDNWHAGPRPQPWPVFAASGCHVVSAAPTH